MDQNAIFSRLWEVKTQRQVILVSGILQMVVTTMLFTDNVVYESSSQNPHFFVLYSSIAVSIVFSIIALVNEKWYQLVPFFISQVLVYTEYLRMIVFPLATKMVEEMKTKKLDFRRFFKYDLTLWICIFILLCVIYAFYCTLSIMSHFYKKKAENLESVGNESSLFSTISLAWNGPVENRENTVTYTVNSNFENSTIKKPYA